MQRAQSLEAGSSEEETNRLIVDNFLNSDVVEATGQSEENANESNKIYTYLKIKIHLD